MIHLAGPRSHQTINKNCSTTFILEIRRLWELLSEFEISMLVKIRFRNEHYSHGDEHKGRKVEIVYFNKRSFYAIDVSVNVQTGMQHSGLSLGPSITVSFLFFPKDHP